MMEVQSPYTVAALSKKPNGVRGEELAGLGFSSSIFFSWELVVGLDSLLSVQRCVTGGIGLGNGKIYKYK